MNQQYKISNQQKRNLEIELSILRTTRMAEVEEMIEQAKELGTLKQNAEYEAALDEQKWLLERIAEIEHILAHAVIEEEQQ